MAHNIARIDGTDQAWYHDKPAWHGLGVVTRNAKTAAQVVKAVPQFRQPVILVPVAIKIGGKWVEDPEKRATVRRGQTSPMGYVSPIYEELTDADALALLEAVITEAGTKARAGFGSAGLLGAKGARGFASIDLTRVFGKELKVKRDPSRNECWLFGDWTHDGTGAMHAGLWRNRVDCNNMLDMANADAAAKGLLVSIRHAGDMKGAIHEAQRVLGLAELVVKNEAALMNELASIPVKPAWMRDFVEYVVPMPDPGDGGKRAVKNREDARDLILGLYRKSDTLVGVPESAYRAHQAVAEYADHARPLRIGADVELAVAADRRFRSITEGPAADLKARSWDFIRQSFDVLTPTSRN